MTRSLRLALGFTLATAALAGPALLAQTEVTVRNDTELKAALAVLKPNTILKIAPGNYAGGREVIGVERLTIAGLDPKNPPHFQGGLNAWRFSRCEGLTVRHLRVSGQTANGFNIDDGGGSHPLVKNITFEGVEISDVGPRGNHDGIKCSGLKDFTIKDCVLSGWGGQGIDCVGCHDGVITGCRFMGKPGFTATAAIQLKGGTAGVVVEKCRFLNAGERPVNVGGSTGLPHFRPSGAPHEASRIGVRNNHIEGSSCAAAFVGVDGAEFSQNTVLFPEKWIFRILQENRAAAFVPCRNVVIQDNRIVFRRAQVQIDVNIGPGTEPATFRFEGNHWFAEDRPAASKPRLPVEEKSGTWGQDPRPKP
jgi:hypothetical protein